MNKANEGDKLEAFPNALMIYINQKINIIEQDLEDRDNSNIDNAIMAGQCQAYEKIIEFTNNYFSNDKSFNRIMKNEHTNFFT